MFIECWVYRVVSYCVYAERDVCEYVKVSLCVFCLRATVMAANSARLIVCLSESFNVTCVVPAKRPKSKKNY